MTSNEMYSHTMNTYNVDGVILKTKRGIDTAVSHEDISTNDKEICMTNYEMNPYTMNTYKVDDVMLKPDRGIDTVEIDNIEDVVPGRGNDTGGSHKDISTYDKEICVTNNEMYSHTMNTYNVDDVILKPERGIDTVGTHEDILSESKDNIKPKASGAALSTVPMIEIRNSTIASTDQTTRQEKGNDIGNGTTSSPAKDTTDTLSNGASESTNDKEICVTICNVFTQ